MIQPSVESYHGGDERLTMRSFTAASMMSVKLIITMIASVMGPTCRQAMQKLSRARTSNKPMREWQPASNFMGLKADLVIKEADLFAADELRAPVEGEEGIGNHGNGHGKQGERDEFDSAGADAAAVLNVLVLHCKPGNGCADCAQRGGHAQPCKKCALIGCRYGQGSNVQRRLEWCSAAGRMCAEAMICMLTKICLGLYTKWYLTWLLILRSLQHGAGFVRRSAVTVPLLYPVAMATRHPRVLD